jgi:hypothetical protein
MTANNAVEATGYRRLTADVGVREEEERGKARHLRTARGQIMPT